MSEIGHYKNFRNPYKPRTGPPIDPTICGHCQHPYPPNLLCCSVIGGRITPPICGLCARQLINEQHGWRKEGFKGKAAELNRLKALAHRQSVILSQNIY
jgi:hypothetical protein